MAANFAIIPGDSQSPVILHVPHSARYIPVEVRSELLLNDSELLEELNSMTDSRTDEIALAATEKVEIRPWLFINKFSRLVIDPERFPDDREIMNKVGMGAVYRKTSTGKDLRSLAFTGEKKLLDNYFHPYAKALEELVTSRLVNVGKVTIIDVHSYRPEQHINAVNHGQRRPAMCIGTDEFHTPINLLNSAQTNFTPLGEIDINEPYAGTYVPLKYYGVEKRVSSIMMETRADTFLDSKFEFTSQSADVIKGLVSLIRDSSGFLN